MIKKDAWYFKHFNIECPKCKERFVKRGLNIHISRMHKTYLISTDKYKLFKYMNKGSKLTFQKKSSTI